MDPKEINLLCVYPSFHLGKRALTVNGCLVTIYGLGAPQKGESSKNSRLSRALTNSGQVCGA